MRRTGWASSISIVPRPISPLTQSEPRVKAHTGAPKITSGWAKIAATRPPAVANWLNDMPLMRSHCFGSAFDKNWLKAGRLILLVAQT